MKVKNPRSRLKQMKRKYFFFSIMIYLSVFFLLFFVQELVSLILEVSPVLKLLLYILIIAASIGITNDIVNNKLEENWPRTDKQKEVHFNRQNKSKSMIDHFYRELIAGNSDNVDTSDENEKKNTD